MERNSCNHQYSDVLNVLKEKNLVHKSVIINRFMCIKYIEYVFIIVFKARTASSFAIFILSFYDCFYLPPKIC